MERCGEGVVRVVVRSECRIRKSGKRTLKGCQREQGSESWFGTLGSSNVWSDSVGSCCLLSHMTVGGARSLGGVCSRLLPRERVWCNSLLDIGKEVLLVSTYGRLHVFQRSAICVFECMVVFFYAFYVLCV